MFGATFHRELGAALVRRLGLARGEEDAEAVLVRVWFTFLLESQALFEQAIFDWRGGEASAGRASRSPSAGRYASAGFEPVRAALAGFQPATDANLDHPYFSRPAPCTMLIDEVEALWSPIAASDDWTILQAKLDDIATMAEAYGTAPIETPANAASY